MSYCASPRNVVRDLREILAMPTYIYQKSTMYHLFITYMYKEKDQRAQVALQNFILLREDEKKRYFRKTRHPQETFTFLDAWRVKK